MPKGIYIRTKPNHWIGRKHTKYSKEKMSLSHQGKKLSKETKKKMSISAKQKGFGLWMKGKTMSKENSQKKSEAMRGSKNHQWKGDNVGYIDLHAWVVRWKGKASKCEICGIENKKRYEWANIDHKYRRVLEDYISLCTKCHRIFDIRNNNYIPFGIKKNENS